MKFLAVAAPFLDAFVAFLPLKSQAQEEQTAVSSHPTSTFAMPKVRQLVVVTAKTWNTNTGELQRFESKDGSTWRSIGELIPVNLGRSGLAWGAGLLPPANGGRQKKEGDGRSPAGIFPLGTAFGSAKELPDNSRGYPYLAVQSSSYCVEDVRSDFYNQLIDANDVSSKVWHKWSPLSRPDGLFRWGVFVNQNIGPTQVGAGSCIFLHIWRAPGVGTAGCTAMAADSISELIGWLDSHLKPTLIQLPRDEYQNLASAHQLPSLNWMTKAATDHS